ncbi:MAG: hypothetical protein NXI19_19865 [Alphaproteobacteria bacterium]|nr:hypothetical protein [Alphaproteobacteria bacterium]
MRHLRMLSEEAEGERAGLATAGILTGDLDDLVEAIGDDWSLSDGEELDLDLNLAALH